MKNVLVALSFILSAVCMINLARGECCPAHSALKHGAAHTHIQ